MRSEAVDPLAPLPPPSSTSLASIPCRTASLSSPTSFSFSELHQHTCRHEAEEEGGAAETETAQEGEGGAGGEGEEAAVEKDVEAMVAATEEEKGAENGGGRHPRRREGAARGRRPRALGGARLPLGLGEAHHEGGALPEQHALEPRAGAGAALAGELLQLRL